MTTADAQTGHFFKLKTTNRQTCRFWKPNIPGIFLIHRLCPVLTVNVANYVEQQISALRSSLRICRTLWQRSQLRRACFGRLRFVARVMSASGVVRRTPRFAGLFGPTNSSTTPKGVNPINLFIWYVNIRIPTLQEPTQKCARRGSRRRTMPSTLSKSVRCWQIQREEVSTYITSILIPTW